MIYEAAACSSSSVGHAALVPWYAFFVLPTWAARIKNRFEQLNIETYLPIYTGSGNVDRHRAGEGCQLFPGYLFARIDGPDNLRAAMQIAGVLRILPTMTRPIAIADDEITNLRKAIATRVTAVPCHYQRGAKVTVISGPLRGVSGVVEQGAPSRIMVGVEMMGRGLSLPFDPQDLGAAA